MPDRSHINQVKHIAITALKAFDLDIKGWKFSWDRAKRRFGSCDYRNKRITLSIHLAKINSIEICKDTVLHEVAHALAGREAGHGPKWIEACNLVGARPERCYSALEINTPQAKYVRYCPSCLKSHPMHRKSRKKYACSACCKKYNKGLYSDKYALLTIERTAYENMLKSISAP